MAQGNDSARLVDGSRHVDEYLAAAPEHVRKRLSQIRKLVKQGAPAAVELISYRIPAFKLHGKQLLYYAAHPQHLGMYPVPQGDEAFERDVAPYRAGKGTLRIAHDQPMPLELIRRFVALHVERVTAQQSMRSSSVPRQKAVKAAPAKKTTSRRPSTTAKPARQSSR